MTLRKGMYTGGNTRLARRRITRSVAAAVAALGISVVGVSVGHADDLRNAGYNVPGYADAHYVGAAKTPVQVRNVKIVDDSFSPKTLVVKVGTKVVWTNTDTDAHTVTRSGRNPLDSGKLKAHATYSFTFHRPGRYFYHCEYHSFMRGSIIVTR